MDKAQKQLYKTYYRKRNLAAKENKNHYGLDKKNNDFFMNKQGELDITGVNVNNLRYRSEREAYNNTKELIKNK